MARISLKRLGKRYRALRQELDTNEKDCTMAMLADRIDIKAPQISNLENGKEPSLLELRAYSNYFNCPMEYLTGDKDNRYYEDSELSNTYGLEGKSIKTLQLIKKQFDLKIGWHNYSYYLDIINLLIQYGNFKDLIHTLHDYLFFDTSKARFIEHAFYTDEKGENHTCELPESSIFLSDEHKTVAFPAGILTEHVLDSILISKIKALRQEIQENNLTKVKSLLQEEEIRNQKDKIEVKNGKSEKN